MTSTSHNLSQMLVHVRGLRAQGVDVDSMLDVHLKGAGSGERQDLWSSLRTQFAQQLEDSMAKYEIFEDCIGSVAVRYAIVDGEASPLPSAGPAAPRFIEAVDSSTGARLRLDKPGDRRLIELVTRDLTDSIKRIDASLKPSLGDLRKASALDSYAEAGMQRPSSAIDASA